MRVKWFESEGNAPRRRLTTKRYVHAHTQEAKDGVHQIALLPVD
jgi:hypothetical protein